MKRKVVPRNNERVLCVVPGELNGRLLTGKLLVSNGGFYRAILTEDDYAHDDWGYDGEGTRAMEAIDNAEIEYIMDGGSERLARMVESELLEAYLVSGEDDGQE